MKDRIHRAAQAVLRDAGFDRKVNRQANPKLNTDRKTVGVAYLVQLHDAIHDQPKPTKLPLSVAQVRWMKNKEGFIKFVFPFELSELMNSVDCINSVISAHASGGDDSMLEDISYRAVGVVGRFRPESEGDVLVEVTGNVSKWLAAQDELTKGDL